MKVLDLVIPVCFAPLAKALQPLATAYSFASPSSSVPQPPTIAPSSALLLFAQQVGLDDYYDAAGTDETVLQLANFLGESQQMMFAGDVLPSSKAIIFIDGIETMPSASSLTHSSSTLGLIFLQVIFRRLNRLSTFRILSPSPTIKPYWIISMHSMKLFPNLERWFSQQMTVLAML